MLKYVLVGMTALALTHPALAAPLPSGARERMHLKRALGPRDLAGAWLMTWGASEWRVTFDEGGGYRCAGTGSLHVGSWSLDERGDLVVTEGLQVAGSDNGAPPVTLFSWTARLHRNGQGQLDVRNLAGEVDARGAFRLRKR
jgi:hypothetical protein